MLHKNLLLHFNQSIIPFFDLILTMQWIVALLPFENSLLPQNSIVGILHMFNYIDTILFCHTFSILDCNMMLQLETNCVIYILQYISHSKCFKIVL